MQPWFNLSLLIWMDQLISFPGSMAWFKLTLMPFQLKFTCNLHLMHVSYHQALTASVISVHYSYFSFFPGVLAPLSLRIPDLFFGGRPSGLLSYTKVLIFRTCKLKWKALLIFTQVASNQKQGTHRNERCFWLSSDQTWSWKNDVDTMLVPWHKLELF